MSGNPSSGGLGSAASSAALERQVAQLSDRVAQLEQRLGQLTRTVEVTPGGEVNIRATRVSIDAQQLQLIAGGTELTLNPTGLALDANEARAVLESGNLTFEFASVDGVVIGSCEARFDTRVDIDAPGGVDLNTGSLNIAGNSMALDVAITNTIGLFQCDTIVARNVVGSSYTPGAGNIW
jgi:hypothetical protein